MGYGIISGVDAQLIEQALSSLLKNQTGNVKVLEIGVCHGDTARGIKAFLGDRIEYYGIDNGRDRTIDPPFPGANLTIGDSTEVYDLLPDNLDFIFIDGCHCINHVMLDFLHYGIKLRKDGLLLFHDTGEPAKLKKDYQGHGPADHPDFYIAASRAISLLQKHGALLEPNWTLVEKKYDSNYPAGGISIYRKNF